MLLVTNHLFKKDKSRILWISRSSKDSEYIKSILIKEGFPSSTYTIIGDSQYKDHLITSSTRFIYIQDQSVKSYLNLNFTQLNEFKTIIFENYSDQPLSIEEQARVVSYSSNKKEDFIMIASQHPDDYVNFYKLYKIDYLLVILDNDPITQQRKDIIYVELNFPIKKLLLLLSEEIKKKSYLLYSNQVIQFPLSNSNILQKIIIVKDREILTKDELDSINVIEIFKQTYLLLINSGIIVSYEYVKGQLSKLQKLDSGCKILLDSFSTLSSEIEADIIKENPKFDHLYSFIFDQIKSFCSIKSPTQDFNFLKILIIVNDPNSIKYIYEKIFKINGVKPYQSNVKLSNIETILNQHNCIIASISDLDFDTIKWSLLSIVIEFDLFSIDKRTEISTFNVLSSIKKIKFIPTINSQPINIFDEKEFQDKTQTNQSKKSCSHTKDQLLPPKNSINQQQVSSTQPLQLSYQFTFIIGETFLQYTKLIYYLQEDYNIKFIERKLPNNVDIVFDERNCLLLVSGLSKKKSAIDHNSFLDNILLIGLQYETCWIIKEDSLQFLMSNEGKQLCRKIITPLSYAKCKVLVRYSFSLQNTAQLIRTISETIAKTSSVWNNSLDIWSNRKWLNEKESRHEQFLSTIPGINPFLAQLLLNWKPLQYFLSTPEVDLKKEFYWVPEIVWVGEISQNTYEISTSDLSTTTIPNTSLKENKILNNNNICKLKLSLPKPIPSTLTYNSNNINNNNINNSIQSLTKNNQILKPLPKATNKNTQSKLTLKLPTKTENKQIGKQSLKNESKSNFKQMSIENFVYKKK
eukprot:gene9012-11033_t